MSAARDNFNDNPVARRFELAVGDEIAFADYRRDESGGKTLEILYVYAPPALRNTGAAGRLMEGIVATAKAEGRKIVPTCGYAAAWLERHP